MHNAAIATTTVCELLINTAYFTSDITIGRLYLSSEQYAQRVDTFCKTLEPLNSLTAEQWVDFSAQVAADFVFCKGLTGVFVYLKELDIISKINKQTAVVARTFKKAVDTHLADNSLLVTAEGIVVKMSNDMQHLGGAGKEIITSSKVLLESAYAKIALEVEQEIKKIREFYALIAPSGFAEFSNKRVKIAYEHILGMELGLSKKGKLSIGGFHHDFKNAIEKSGVLDFTNKVFNEHGCYSADLIIDGKSFTKTFFPKNWSRKEVSGKIYEAYGNFIKSGVIPELRNDGKYRIVGLTNEGIAIEMHITQKGLIKTAYPVFE